MSFRNTAGVTVIELGMAIAVAGIMLAVSYAGYREFNEAITLRKAAGVVASDLSLTRSFAIQRRANVSLVANEAARSYVIRDADGTTLGNRIFDASSGLPLDFLTVHTLGDSVTFNSRGLLATAGAVEVDVGRQNRTQRIFMNALGRYSITRDP